MENKSASTHHDIQSIQERLYSACKSENYKEVDKLLKNGGKVDTECMFIACAFCDAKLFHPVCAVWYVSQGFLYV